jgi:hypothetical protein
MVRKAVARRGRVVGTYEDPETGRRRVTVELPIEAEPVEREWVDEKGRLFQPTDKQKIILDVYRADFSWLREPPNISTIWRRVAVRWREECKRRGLPKSNPPDWKTVRNILLKVVRLRPRD